jgi:hypothetical protein
MNRAALAVVLCASGCRAIFGLDDPGDPGAQTPDAEVDAVFKECWGTEINFCFPSPLAEVAALTLAGPLDTSTASQCNQLFTAQCVVAASKLTIGARDGSGLRPLNVTGSRPLVLIAADAISVVEGGLDVASHSGKPGPAAMTSSCNSFAAPPLANRGGGAGGTLGGIGGAGGAGQGGAGGQPASMNMLDLNGLRAGCRGQDGGGAATQLGTGGLGGGAAYLIAGRAIEVGTGAKINASGAGGRGAICTGQCGTAMNGTSGGGGGGGTGGMLLLEAPAISSAGLIFADGGGGGEGSSISNNGLPGADPDGTKSAPGGTGGNSNGGKGGAGSYTSTPNGTGGTDFDAAAAGPPGGGGGGGGKGIIRIYGAPAINGGTVSPPAQRR